MRSVPPARQYEWTLAITGLGQSRMASIWAVAGRGSRATPGRRARPRRRPRSGRSPRRTPGRPRRSTTTGPRRRRRPPPTASTKASISSWLSAFSAPGLFIVSRRTGPTSSTSRTGSDGTSPTAHPPPGPRPGRLAGAAILATAGRSRISGGDEPPAADPRMPKRHGCPPARVGCGRRAACDTHHHRDLNRRSGATRLASAFGRGGVPRMTFHPRDPSHRPATSRRDFLRRVARHRRRPAQRGRHLRGLR